MKHLKKLLMALVIIVCCSIYVGCGTTDNTANEIDVPAVISQEIDSLNNQLDALANTEKYMSINEKSPEQEFNPNKIVDYTKLLQIMTDNKDKYTYVLGNIELNEEFFKKSYEEQVELLNIFKFIGTEEKTVATEYNYVPTGEKTADGKDITKYEATEYTKVVSPIFVKVNDIECVEK